MQYVIQYVKFTSIKTYDVMMFKVCKPVHHRTIQINHQLGANFSSLLP